MWYNQRIENKIQYMTPKMSGAAKQQLKILSTFNCLLYMYMCVIVVPD